MLNGGRGSEPGLVGPYRLLQRLGEGGMGVVHLALDPNGRAVAIKVLRAHIANDPDARRRLEREVATLRRVQHPRVAAVIDADVDADVPYLVTHFVPGKPLDTHVKEHGPLPRGHIARIGAVLADALRAIHAAGVVHRDVKPANVMLLDGEPILIDFGIAHVADESRITHTGLVMGTPGYLSPEIIGGDPVTEATDWWGWGATLAFAATGRPPFGSGPVEVILDRVRRGASDVDGVDEGLRRTLTMALSVDPTRRPAPEQLVAGLAAVPGRPSARPAPARRDVVDLDAVTARVVDAPTVVVPPPELRHEAVTTRVPPPPPAYDVRPANGFHHAPVAAPPREVDYDEGPAGADPRYAGFGPEGETPVEGTRPPGDPGRGVLLGALLALAAVAGVAPWGAVWLAWAALTGLRVVDRSVAALTERRDLYGPRGSDAVVTVAAMPWRIAVAGLTQLLMTVLPGLVGVSVAFISASVLAGSPATAVPSSPLPLAAGMAALLVTAWSGPGGASLRRGGRIAVRRTVNTHQARTVAWCLLALVLIAVVMVAAGQGSPDWGPWTGSRLVEFLSR